jgi:DNA-binding MarR family transcriptional regulator
MSTPADRLRNFGFLIKDIGRLYTKLFEYQADHLSITLAEAKVLTCLSRNANLNQVQLAELSGVEPMSLVRILDRMEADNWIERRPHPTDRRARQLHLKDKAQSALDQIWKLSGQIRAQALAEFSSDERNALVELLERVHAKMSEMTAEQTGKTSPKVAQIDRKDVERRSRRISARTVRSRNGKSQRVTR